MTYLDRKNSSSKAKSAIIWIASIAVIIFGVQLIFPSFFTGIFTSMTAPFWRAGFSISSGSLNDAKSLLRENEELKRRIDELKIESEFVEAVRSENAEIKSSFGRATSTGGILAAVLVKPPISGFDMLIIDMGNDYGLKEGDMVYAPGNVLVGKIAEVSKSTSKVNLFTSVKSEYQVEIGPSKSPAPAIGRGGGQYVAELPRDVRVEVGDFVTIPSITSSPFGVVVNVNIDPASPFQKILFAPPVNIYEIRWVYVKKI